MNKTASYTVSYSEDLIDGSLTAPSPAEPVAITCFRPESSDHRPETTLWLWHNNTSIMGLFEVRDQYVRAVNTTYCASVCQDSCVEFFASPARELGYINFEFNCGGTCLASHVTDWRRTATGFKAYAYIPEQEGKTISTFHSLPREVSPEIIEPVTWKLGFSIPVQIYATRFSIPGKLSGQRWHANFYKCGDRTSHPHWASWKPVTALNFHLPECFGEITFEKP